MKVIFMIYQRPSDRKWEWFVFMNRKFMGMSARILPTMKKAKEDADVLASLLPKLNPVFVTKKLTSSKK